MNKMTFEEAVKKLDEMVQSFNNTDLTLDDAVKNYEEGMKLYKYCKDLVEKAENKFETIGEELK
ncbi:Exodeoxyribonuclease VII small subunit [Dethiosulfatibacter aminovorans DSM 17477]|uniref:Exodeoxyribonuclease 7 small subunit n=1 Tax=Dethiosulfatibacter aminovorans DSM 17477 TaxID=1121476 RepID=A0A1M6D917_9FIRM|nr:exodeoxyribonuclease VII small subunit [Dethiosulfatibacter aminovorans]SHI69746.1 Exodeoxyribonuclease VII small subunit [Dethiosulfatibacter aminovorans DSM 17477]